MDDIDGQYEFNFTRYSLSETSRDYGKQGKNNIHAFFLRKLVGF